MRLDGEGLRLPGALGRVASLRLRSKQPGGGLLAVGRLALLRSGCSGGDDGGCSSAGGSGCGGGCGGGCGSRGSSGGGAAGEQHVLRELCLRACEVASWRGLEGCGRLQHLALVHCRFATPEAAHGLAAALAALPRLTTLELRCATRAGGSSSSGSSGSSSNSSGRSSPTAAAAAARRGSGGGGPGGGGGSGGGVPEAAVHCVLVPDLVGLGVAVAGLTALRLAAPLSEAALNQLLRVELPRIRSVSECGA